jgi:anti-sigma factor RsiW
MDHGITDQEWIAYLDGEAAMETRDLIEAHMTGCLRFAQSEAMPAEQMAQAELRGRLDTLETVLAPMCGAQAAARVLHTAARHSPARSLADVTHENWEPFMERLTAITAAMCGDTFASLVWERGQL